MARRILLTIEYDGTAYSGWQRQYNGLAVQQLIEEALTRATGEAIAITGASRTDAGVHALGQCAHFDTSSRIPPEKYPFVLNTMLPRDIRVQAGREVPDGFVFALKGPRFATNRRVLAEAGDSIKRFYDSGVLELGDHLGPVLWQFAPTKTFHEPDFAAFLALLPRDIDGRALRHAVEVRHHSFCVPSFVTLLRQHGVAVVFSEHESYPAIADITTDFIYARLQKGQETIATGYPDGALDAWAARFRQWAEGGEPADLPRIMPSPPPARQPRDVFGYVIHEAKLRAPAAAMALIERLR